MSDLHPAGQDYGEATPDLANPYEDLPCPIAANLAKPAQALDLGRLKDGERLLPAGFDDRRS
jgi:hypothetical protein